MLLTSIRFPAIVLLQRKSVLQCFFFFWDLIPSFSFSLLIKMYISFSQMFVVSEKFISFIVVTFSVFYFLFFIIGCEQKFFHHRVC